MSSISSSSNESNNNMDSSVLQDIDEDIEISSISDSYSELLVEIVNVVSVSVTVSSLLLVK